MEPINKLANSNWTILCLAGILALVLTASATAQQALQKFVFCYEDTELYPSFVGNSSNVPDILPGVSIDIVRMIGNRTDLDVSFVRFPWKRCLSLLKSGRADGVIASYSESRLALGLYPMVDGKPDGNRRISTSGYYMYQLEGTKPVWDGKSFCLPNLVIGAPLGYSIVERLKQQGLKVMEAGNAEGLLTMLRRSRVDAVAAPGLATDTMIKRHPARFKGIVRVPHPLQIKNYYLMLSHQFVAASPDTAEAMWDAAKSIRERAEPLIQDQY